MSKFGLFLTVLLGILVLAATGGCANPTPTQPSPVAAGNSDETQFSDSFDTNANGWDLESVASRWLEWSFASGGLQAARTGRVVPFSGLMRFALAVPNRTFGDFQITLDAFAATQTSGIGYGIFVGQADGSRYYFELDTSGMASVFLEQEPDDLHPQFIQEPAPVTVSPDGIDQMAVSVAGSAMTFSVNGTQVASVTGAQPGQHATGLFVEVVPGSGTDTGVAFDNLLVQPGP